MILNQNESWKGITFYGDDQNWMALVRKGNQLAVRIRLDGKEQKLLEQRSNAPLTY